MANLEQISQFCRLCLVKDDVNTPIFDDQEDIRQIYLKISSCLPVKISKEDNLPKKICGICTDKLDTVYAFWKITVQSEKQLIEWLKQIGVETGKPSGSLDHTNKVEPLILKQEIVDPIEIRTDGDGAADTSVSSDSEKANVDTAINKQKSQTSSEACGNIDEPPTKRARRAAAFKRPILEPDSEEEDDPIEAKVEDYSDDSDGEDNQDDNDPDFVLDNDDHSNADDQPGPSGVGKSEEPPVGSIHLEPVVMITESNSWMQKLPEIDVSSIKKEVDEDQIPWKDNEETESHILKKADSILKKVLSKKPLIVYKNPFIYPDTKSKKAKNLPRRYQKLKIISGPA